MKRIDQVKIGDKVSNEKNGNGLVTGKTKRTITVTFHSGNQVKVTYKYNDAPFFESDF